MIETRKIDDKLTMFIDIEQQSKKTKEYAKHIFRELLKHEPLREGKVIEININESSTPFPEFTEVPFPQRNGPSSAVDEAGRKTYFSHKVWESDKDVPDQIRDKNSRRDFKIDMLSGYTRGILGNGCKMHYAEATDDGPINIDFSFTVTDRKQIYLNAERLGLITIGGSYDYLAKESQHPVFKDNPPRILWNNKEVMIPANSKQFYICRIAFDHGVKVPISWDIAAEMIDGVKKEDFVTKERGIYDVVRAVNKKFSEAFGKDLLEFSEHSFYRLY